MAHDFEREARGAPVPEEFATDGVSTAAANVLRVALDPSNGRSAGRDAMASFERVAQGEGTFEGRWSLPGGVTIPKLGRHSSSGCASTRENSAENGVRGMGSLGAWTLRRGIWTAAVIGVLTTFVLLAHLGPSRSIDITRTYATPAGQQATLTLDDGTRVILAPQTTLRLVHFGRSSREVTLDRGEAYFTVARVSGTPFVVYSGAASARVLGTAFLVRNDASGKRVRVAVESGRVRVANISAPLWSATLASGQTGDVVDSTVLVSTDELMPGVERSPGQLKFHDTPVATILQMVSRWYGYQFRYADQDLAKRPVSMAISTQSSAEALATIELVLAVNLAMTGDTITLTPQPTKSTRTPSRTHTYDIWTPTREAGR